MARINGYGVQKLTFVDELPESVKIQKTDWLESLSPLKREKWAFIRSAVHNGNAHASKRGVEKSLERKGEDLRMWEFTVRPLVKEKRWGVFGRFIGKEGEAK